MPADGASVSSQRGTRKKKSSGVYQLQISRCIMKSSHSLSLGCWWFLAISLYTIRRLCDFIVLQKAVNCCKVITKNTYINTVIKESDCAVMEEFIDDIKIVINALGYKVLEPLITHSPAGIVDNDLLYISIGDAKATGKTTTEGFVVLKGAIINEKMNPKSLSSNIINLRNKLLGEKFNNLTSTEDILFSSSSAAADFILGYSVTGPKTWKDKNGKTLKEIEAEKSNPSDQ